MKKWIVGYCKFKEEQWQYEEKEVEAKDFDDAYMRFRRINPSSKIRFIQEVN